MRLYPEDLEDSTEPSIVPNLLLIKKIPSPLEIALHYRSLTPKTGQKIKPKVHKVNHKPQKSPKTDLKNFSIRKSREHSEK